MRNSHSVVSTPLALVIMAMASGANADDTAPFAPNVSEGGAISVPDNYRNEMSFVGTWAIRAGDEEGSVEGFHNVYMDLSAILAFQQTGEFPDGAVIVKELLSAENGSKTTGNVAWAGDITGWFVMIKDQTKRFPDNKLWGNGWGWSYFGADDPVNTTSTNFRRDCLGCHIPARQTDWIFMDGYPILKAEQ